MSELVWVLALLNVVQLIGLVVVVGLLAPRRQGAGAVVQPSRSLTPDPTVRQPAFYQGPQGITRPTKDKPA